MMTRILTWVLWPVRLITSVFVLALDLLPQSPRITRTPAQQSQVDRETQGLVLYHMQACPFCVKVRRHARSLGLNLPMRDIRKDPAAADELVRLGGQDQVPCLRIGGSQWMYESSDINDYLTKRFGGAV
jgi:glutaredoxin